MIDVVFCLGSMAVGAALMGWHYRTKYRSESAAWNRGYRQGNYEERIRKETREATEREMRINRLLDGTSPRFSADFPYQQQTTVIGQRTDTVWQNRIVQALQEDDSTITRTR